MRRTPKLRKMTSQWLTEKVTCIVLSSLAWKMVVIRQMDKLVTLARKRWKRRALFTSCLLDFGVGGKRGKKKLAIPFRMFFTEGPKRLIVLMTLILIPVVMIKIA